MKKKVVLCFILVVLCIISSVVVGYALSPSESFTNASGGGSVSVSSNDASGDTCASHPWYDMDEVSVSIDGRYMDYDDYQDYAYSDYCTDYDTTCAYVSYSIDEGYVLYVYGTHTYTAGPDSEYVETYAD